MNINNLNGSQPYKRDNETSPQYPCTQKEFNVAYKYQKVKTSTIHKKLKKIYYDLKIFTLVSSLFPVLKWLPQYEFKKDLPSDIIAGFTVAIMHIPQGMAYASLGAVNPIVGIYMAIFPILMYFLMGTSHHISMGSFSVVCLMAGKPVAMYSTIAPNNTKDSSKTNDTSSMPSKTYTPTEVASVVSFTVGIFQVLLGLCRVGSLSMFLSEPLISGFITGAAVLVFTSQLQHVFGVELPSKVVLGSFNVLNTLYYIGKDISKTNFVALGMCLATITILSIYTQFIQHRLKRYQYLLPMELIIMLVSTCISYFCSFSQKHFVKVVGEIPSGIISPYPPPVELVQEPSILLNCLIIAIVSFSINISMATIFSKKDQYHIDSNQEFVASGFANVLGGFFGCLPIATSLSRSMLQYKSGGKTQLASIFSSIFLLSVILYLGKFLGPLPYSVLAGIVVVCLRSMLMQAKDLPKIWKKSTSDGVIWLVTFLAVVLLDIHIGLMVALVLAILSIVVMNQNIHVSLLGRVPNTNLFLEIDRYQEAIPITKFVLIKIHAGLHFANAHVATNKIERILKESQVTSLYNEKTLVIDMSGVVFVDPTALSELGTFIEDLKRDNVQIYLAQCSVYVYEQMKKCNFFSVFSESDLFPSIQDAINLTDTKELDHSKTDLE